MSIPSWARVGAKVVCVDASPGDTNRARGYVEGAIYTLRRVYFEGNSPACVLEEFPLGAARLNRFRPLITQSDDIEAHFRKLLDVPVTREREGA